MIDVATQRQNMVESQVMTDDVTDRRIIQAMRQLPRERFVPPAMVALAYIDEAIAITPGADPDRRWLLAPRVLAKLLQLADIDSGDRVLEIGSGSGYGTAVLAGFGGEVIGLECSEDLAKQARANLAALDIRNAMVTVGDLPAGYPDKAPYDAIIVSGAIAMRPDDLFDQLKDGGRLVAVTLQDGLGRATIWRRLGRSFDARAAFDAAAPVLPGFERRAEFVL